MRNKIDEQNNVWVDNPIPIKIRDNSKPILVDKKPLLVNGKPLDTPLWTRNPYADVAVMYAKDLPFEKTFKPLSADVLAADKLLSDANIKPGDELRCLGYPLGVASNDAGFPVLRSGRIASYSIVPTDKTKTFLLDLRVFKGNSGGPVFFTERFRVIPNKFGTYEHFHFLMELVSEEGVLYRDIDRTILAGTSPDTARVGGSSSRQYKQENYRDVACALNGLPSGRGLTNAEKYG
jgi:hypothetical protein